LSGHLQSPSAAGFATDGIPAEEWIAIRFAYLFVPDGPLRMKWSLQSSVREGAAAGSLTSTLSLGLRLGAGAAVQEWIL